MKKTIRVNLGARSYDIEIGPGLLASAAEHLAPWSGRRIAVISDKNVAAIYLEPLMAQLAHAGMPARSIVLPAGEESKSFATLEKVCLQLLDMEISRSDVIIALGGGVIGDLTGFAAAILKRGVHFIQIPTSLLAQVDSSVGGKTAINVPQGKNLIGTFHQPSLVLADTDTLNTLSHRERVNGYAEVAKYGALGDAKYFDWLEVNAKKALAGDSEIKVEMVAHACQMKADIVARDETENNVRALLNLGHTFGHALEAATGFSDRLKHGEGVAVGCALAFRLSVKLGLCHGQDAERYIRHLRETGLPADINDIPGERPQVAELIEHMHHDKKVKDGKIRFVLLHALGDAFVTDEVPTDALQAVLAE